MGGQARCLTIGELRCDGSVLFGGIAAEASNPPPHHLTNPDSVSPRLTLPVQSNPLHLVARGWGYGNKWLARHG
jgi:hypothetical protein